MQNGPIDVEQLSDVATIDLGPIQDPLHNIKESSFIQHVSLLGRYDESSPVKSRLNLTRIPVLQNPQFACAEHAVWDAKTAQGTFSTTPIATNA